MSGGRSPSDARNLLQSLPLIHPQGAPRADRTTRSLPSGRPDGMLRPDPVANPPYGSFPSINLERLKNRHDPTAVLLYGNGRVG
jgi:hypothetical protein